MSCDYGYMPLHCPKENKNRNKEKEKENQRK